LIADSVVWYDRSISKIAKIDIYRDKFLRSRHNPAGNIEQEPAAH
jgi:hypothetical protein